MNGFKKFIRWIVYDLLHRGKPLICARCKRKIEEPTYILIRGTIVVNNGVPNPEVFTCPEQAFNYAQGFVLHAVCWIEMLKEYGVKLYDLGKVYAEYAKKNKQVRR